jgi:hypothetical protein
MLWPGKITIHLHDTMETTGLRKEDVPALRDRVRAIISAPVEAALKAERANTATAMDIQQESQS